MAQKISQMQMRHLYFNLKDLFSNRKGFVILTSLLRFKNKSREFRENMKLKLGTFYLSMNIIVDSYSPQVLVIALSFYCYRHYKNKTKQNKQTGKKLLRTLPLNGCLKREFSQTKNINS